MDTTLLEQAVQGVLDAGVRPSMSDTHDTQQFYLGIWCKYSSAAFLTAHSRPSPRAQRAVDFLRSAYDVSTRKIMHHLLRIDPDTAKAMKSAHRGTAELLHALYEAFYAGELPNTTFNQLYTTIQAMDRNFIEGRDTSTRFGGAGTVLCVSLGDVDRFHIDTGDSPRYPSVVFCTQPAILHVQMGRCMLQVPLAPGDVVGFSASQYLHKLVRAGTEPPIVFTAWTEAQTVERARKWGADHYFVA